MDCLDFCWRDWQPLGFTRSRIFFHLCTNTFLPWVYSQLPCKRKKIVRVWKYYKDLCRDSLQYYHFSCFLLIFLSISPLAWSGARNFLALKANTLLRLCPSALVTCPWMPASMACSAETRAAADPSASCLQVRESKTQPLCSAWSQNLYSWTVGLCLKGLSQPKWYHEPVTQCQGCQEVPASSLLLCARFSSCISVWSWKNRVVLFSPPSSFISLFVSCKWEHLPTNT